MVSFGFVFEINEIKIIKLYLLLLLLINSTGIKKNNTGNIKISIPLQQS